MLTISPVINIMLITGSKTCKKYLLLLTKYKKEEESMNKIENLQIYKQALIVVDMVNGFVKEGVLHDQAIAKIVPRQIELIKDYQEKKQIILFIKDTHQENATEFKRFGSTKHCLKESREASIIDELKPYTKGSNVIEIEKNSTSYMEAPLFREIIKKAHNLKEIDVVGCCTDICVFNGTMALANYFDQWNLDVLIRVHQDAIATYNEANRKEYVDAANLLMTQQGIQLVKKFTY